MYNDLPRVDVFFRALGDSVFETLDVHWRASLGIDPTLALLFGDLSSIEHIWKVSQDQCDEFP